MSLNQLAAVERRGAMQRPIVGPCVRLVLLSSLLGGLSSLTAGAPAGRGSPGERDGGGLPDITSADSLPPAGVAKYNTLFGEEEKRVLATPSTKDDARFAATLLQKVPSLKDEPGLPLVLYAKAYELGMKDPDGFATALEALDARCRLDPAFKQHQASAKYAEWARAAMAKGRPPERAAGAARLTPSLIESADELAAARKYADAIKGYREALSIAQSARLPLVDDINAKLKDVTARQQAMEKLQKLQVRADAGDAAAGREMLDTALLTLDDPALAQKYAQYAPDAVFRANLARAVKRASSSASQEDLLELANWYKALAAQPRLPSGAKGNALTHAQMDYCAFLDAHVKQDAQHLLVVEALAAVTKELAVVEGPPLTADRIVLWNTHNSISNNVGSTVVNVVLSLRGTTAWRRDNLPIKWEANQDCSLTIPCPHTAFDSVRVEVVHWAGVGGGLAEIQVLRGDRNLALGGTVTASGSVNEFPAATVVDNITTSATNAVGYWVPPLRQPAWIEVSLHRPEKAPSQ